MFDLLRSMWVLMKILLLETHMEVDCQINVGVLMPKTPDGCQLSTSFASSLIVES